MSKTRYADYLDRVAQKYPYILVETGEVLGNVGDIKQKINGFGQSLVDSNGPSYVSDYSFNLSCPSIWGGHSDVAVVADGGLCISVDKLEGSYLPINSSGNFYANGYLRVQPPNKQAFYFHLQNSALGQDISTNHNQYSYTNGKALHLEFSNKICQSSWFFGNDGIIYFAFNADYNIKLGRFGAGYAIFDPIGELEPHKLYMLASYIGVAQGTVKDKTGKPMVNCRLGAFRRDNFAPVGMATSDEQGYYRMPLGVQKGEWVFIVCLDNDTAPDFEALIYDRIQVL